MYKLVIIDDEQDVRLRIKSLVEKANKKFEIVGLYENGIEAYDGALTVMPDLIITDIKIPYIDGLETLKRILKVQPLVKSIVITGFDEFDYAKQAANLGVLGFISKPVSQQDIESVLTKAQNELEREFSFTENLKKLEGFHQKSLPLIRENYLSRLLTLTHVSDNFRHKLETDGIYLKFEYMLLAIVDLDDEMNFEQYDTAFTAIKKEFEESVLSTNVFMRYEKLYVLIKSNETIKSEDIENLFLLLILKAKRYYFTSLSVGISDLSKENHNFKQMNFEALKSLEYRTIMGGNKVFLYSNIKGSQSVIKIDESDYKEIVYAIKHKGANEALKILYDFKIRIAKNQSSQSYYHFISNILNSIINSCNDLDSLFLEYAAYDDIYKHIFGIKNFDDVFTSFEHLIVIVRQINGDSIQKSIDYNLNKIKRYIELNYADCSLGLETIAEEIKLSVSYISTLLKKENTSFVKYLTTQRIQKAQELLLNSSYKIVEISEQVGYSDPYYFSHCFKKYTGVSPKEYRANENK